MLLSVDQETGEAILNWNYTEANDFQYFNVYREEELIGTTTELTYTDTLTEFGYYNYHVTAFYGGENESSAVSFLTQYGTSTVNIDPNTYTANVYINSTAQQTMVIRNEGVLDLTYSISPFLRTNVIKQLRVSCWRR